MHLVNNHNWKLNLKKIFDKLLVNINKLKINKIEPKPIITNNNPKNLANCNICKKIYILIASNVRSIKTYILIYIIKINLSNNFYFFA
jgi:hypothetical protein